MANPKSNIYPIQLQGAELNLNEYKAEIKQYSGFNKNNSPYVGGCLSNLFTKDETVGTPDTTYIDKNGDVYTVNTSGLYKNDEKVLDCVGANFFDIENMGKNAFPENVAYVFNEKIYILSYYNELVIHAENADGTYLEERLYRDDENFKKIDYISFNIQKIDNISQDFYIVTCVLNFTSNLTPSNKSIITVTKALLNIEDRFYLEGTGTQIESVTNKQPKRPVVIKQNIVSNVVHVIVLSGSTYDCNYHYTLNLSTFEFSYQNKLNVILETSGNDFPYKGSYVFTDNYYKFLTNRDMNEGFYISYLFKNYSINNNFTSVIIQEGSSLSSNPSVYFDLVPSLINNWGIFTATKSGSLSPGGDDDGFAFMIDDEVTTFAYLTDDMKLENNMGGILNSMVLVNNNTVSGISLPGGWILASEWNSIDENHIYFGHYSDGAWKNSNYYCLWKDINTGDWYKLKKSIPKLKEVNGQIIINANILKNSYRINDGKTLLFAPAWNNRRPSSISTTAVARNPQYMATTINEYLLGDNTSLLLNPVLVNHPSIGFSIPLISDKFIDTFANISVNIYSGKEQIKYEKSLIYIHSGVPEIYGYYNNKNLDGLPFPTTTDGNVQYSPSLFADFISNFGNDWYIKYGSNAYQLMKSGSQSVMSFYLGTLVEDLEELFIIQGQYYGIINNCLYSIQYSNGLLQNINYVCSVLNLQFCGATPYQAIFFSKTNRTLYSFTGANILQIMQPIDSISEVISYKYNPATQSIFLLTNAGVIVNGLFGMFQIAFKNPSVIYLLTEGFVIGDNEGHCKYVRYYPAEDYTRENIELETCFYGSNDTLVLVNDCLYLRLFSDEKESGEVEISATTLTNEGKTTERTTFKIKASDWDDKTNTVYLRYQPKEQRGLGISFKVNSPFKIAAMSVGTSADTILIDKVSKGAIINPQQTSSNTEW